MRLTGKNNVYRGRCRSFDLQGLGSSKLTDSKFLLLVAKTDHFCAEESGRFDVAYARSMVLGSHPDFVQIQYSLCEGIINRT